MRAFVTDNQNDWLYLLPFAEFAHDNVVHSSTEMTPFYANYGFHPRLTFESKSLPDLDPNAAHIATTFNVIHTRLHDNLSKAQFVEKKFADRNRMDFPLLAVGDYVLLNTVDLPRCDPSIPTKVYEALGLTPSLQHRFIGPFKILELISELNYRLDLPDL